jgi:hypothetical protein
MLPTDNFVKKIGFIFVWHLNSIIMEVIGLCEVLQI